VMVQNRCIDTSRPMRTEPAPEPQPQTIRAKRRANPRPKATALRRTQIAASPEAIQELPPLRFEVHEAARMLRMSRAQIYNRMKEGLIMAQKDGVRTYITRAELDRYVASCASGIKAS
jgi:DNA-binding NtrC family response regulator